MNVRSVTVNAWPSRYELLDGLRGVAALGVVLHHLGVVEDGHFAVMVFFVISGYCITASAESCRRDGLGFRQFMVRRIKRIYPPYLLAIAFFSLTRGVKAAMGGQNDLQRPVLDWVQNLTLTQWISNAFHPISWPSDNPHLFVTAFWSLNYEEQFYLIMAIALTIATNRRIPLIAPVVLLATIGLAWNFSIPGNWICGFFIEYWVHFALGACLYFALCVFTDWRSRLAFVAGVLLLGLASAARLMPWTATTAQDLRSMVELAFLSFATLGLFFLRPLSPVVSRSMMWRPIAALGTISYSLYLIHQFNLNLVASIAQRVLPGGVPRFVLIMTMAGLHVGLATLFWYACERPFLSKKTAPGPIISGAVDAARAACR
jgi:peptidoglycan/LPS O-acetylase OafA/YrhL